MGAFGKVKVGYFTKLAADIDVAVKIGRSGEFLAVTEEKILHRLAGHICFPFTFEVYQNFLVMELIRKKTGNEYILQTISSELDKTSLSRLDWTDVCCLIADATAYMLTHLNTLFYTFSDQIYPSPLKSQKAPERLKDCIFGQISNSSLISLSLSPFWG